MQVANKCLACPFLLGQGIELIIEIQFYSTNTTFFMICPLEDMCLCRGLGNAEAFHRLQLQPPFPWVGGARASLKEGGGSSSHLDLGDPQRVRHTLAITRPPESTQSNFCWGMCWLVMFLPLGEFMLCGRPKPELGIQL